jgi:Uma2 family endonuclease
MTTQQTTAAPPVSLEEYAALPKHPRYELAQGVLVELMVASEEHEHTGSLVVIRVGNHVLLNRLGRVYLSNRGYVTGPDSPATSRMPDVSFVSNARLSQPDLAGMLYHGAPDLAIEILSESNTPTQIAQKIREYLGAGGKAVWVIDIDARTLTVYTVDAAPLVLTDADTVGGGDYLPGFACAVADLLPAIDG